MADVPPLDASRVFVVTGASAGIGRWTATGLARAGATVVVVGRHPTKTPAVAEEIRAETGNPQVFVECADFASLDAVRGLALRLGQRFPTVDTLVNNAGLWLPSRQVSEDGFEMTFAVNHLAPFLLTREILPRLTRRVVVVSSRLHVDVPGLDFTDLHFETRRYRGLAAYSHSKLANLLFVTELARRAPHLDVFGVHPGDVATEVTRGSRLITTAQRWVEPLLLTPEEGAQTSLHAATDPALSGRSGAYLAGVSVAECARAARDVEAARRLWDVSEALTGPRGSPSRPTPSGRSG